MRLLSRGADLQPVHLSPKAYELLGVLVDTRPRAVAKRELHERLWPSTFVSEAFELTFRTVTGTGSTETQP
jgi:DNA-binding winged helix-turn-helix (wHTH) protein